MKKSILTIFLLLLGTITFASLDSHNYESVVQDLYSNGHISGVDSRELLKMHSELDLDDDDPQDYWSVVAQLDLNGSISSETAQDLLKLHTRLELSGQRETSIEPEPETKFDAFMEEYGGLVYGGIIIVFLLMLSSGVFFVVSQGEVEIIERLGRFQTVARPGLNLKIPLIDSQRMDLSTRLLELEVELETKTDDDVFVGVTTSVMYQIIPGKEQDAAYKLEDEVSQIDSYVNDILRAEIPKMKLDQVFKNKEDLNIKVNQELKDAMEMYGYVIQKTLITDIEPDEVVKKSMNAINASERKKVAEKYNAEALVIKRTGEGEAESEFKRLQGEGMAKQRVALANGIKESLEVIKKAGATSEEANALMVLNQHYDTLQSIGKDGNLIMMDNSPNAGMRNFQEMTAAFAADKFNTKSAPEADAGEVEES